VIGIVLWYNTDKEVGLVWCEDQGPLAYIGPEVAVPRQVRPLGCGDQITFLHEVRDKVRYVTAIERVDHGRTMADPQAVLAAYHENADNKGLRVVA
jgi:hypothetical protein